jgi:hypothetical protein
MRIVPRRSAEPVATREAERMEYLRSTSLVEDLRVSDTRHLQSFGKEQQPSEGVFDEKTCDL